MTLEHNTTEQPSWRLFHGDRASHPLRAMPEAPPWRKPRADPKLARAYDDKRPEMSEATRQRGITYQASEEIVQMVNAALHLRRPLLVTGAPGTGKSSLIDAVALELGLGEPLRWPVNSRSTLREALYNYDAIGRAQHRANRQEDADALKDEDFLELGPLGTALVPALRPRPLLIDEMDKADVDLANDLLNVLEEGQFHIRELSRLPKESYAVRMFGSEQKVEVVKGSVARYEFPLLIITSNGERGFPPAFLRRCLQVKMPDPASDVQRLTEIVAAHLDRDTALQAKSIIRQFVDKAAAGETVATDQLLNAVQLVFGGYRLTEADRDAMVERLMVSLAGNVR
ncbi:AAA family ATPase [Pseudoduganella armeniaca]|uniref:AAA family ATPase n=1 Tax=Pseudoduganella armeniaca TaxID=2072590 RepID=A0A2R4CBC9_9BURK|nr:MoxR family ATPase [Pseudoduganella armeniaca]AVR96913.1 AAA family ATPase [Pseudoduganella armeniaca]